MNGNQMAEKLEYAIDKSYDSLRLSKYIGEEEYIIDIDFKYKYIVKRKYRYIFSDNEIDEISFEELQMINKLIEEYNKDIK